MKLKKLIVLLLCLLCTVSLCGCDLLIFDAEELLAPPKLTGDMRPIGEALRKSVGGGYTLKYPTSGDRRSAVILEDIDGDATFEALAFYSTSDDELINMHINIIRRKGEEWVSVADQSIVAAGVEMIDFCDLDGDGVLEILVGWEIYGSSEKQLAVYSLTNDVLTQRLLQQYTGFLCCDLDGNEQNEIFIHLLNATEGTNKATVYNLHEGGIQQTAGCMMDAAVKTAQAPRLADLSNGKPAIYIDEIKGVGAVTEVLFLQNGELVNPLLDTENAYENTKTLRASALSLSDINGDGILEIPVASELPAADGSQEKLYYTNWCSFNGEKLTTQLVTVHNTVDGYYLTLPTRLVGKIAITKDVTNHRRIVHSYDSEKGIVGGRLVTINAVEIDIFDDADYDKGNYAELARNDTYVFCGAVYENGEISVTFEELSEMFKLVEG